MKSEDTAKMKEGKSFVSMVISGEYKWYDKNVPNVLQGIYNISLITMQKTRPKDVEETVENSEKICTKWFKNQHLDGKSERARVRAMGVNRREDEYISFRNQVEINILCMIAKNIFSIHMI